MKKALKDRLETNMIDVSGALNRFMGNEAFFERFLKKFLNDSSYEKLVAAIDAGDREKALMAAHTLKGVCGNLSITGLYALMSQQVEAFRADDWDKGMELMPQIAKEYETVVKAIRSLD